jgi:hypothetical protein
MTAYGQWQASQAVESSDEPKTIRVDIFDDEGNRVKEFVRNR